MALSVVTAPAGVTTAADIPTASCAYVEAGRPGPMGNRLEIAVDKGYPTVVRWGSQVRVRHQGWLDCEGPTATVTNIDRIVATYTGHRHLVVNWARGRLGPGASESGPGAEIEVVLRGPTSVVGLHAVAGDRTDAITQGRVDDVEVLNLNPAEERRDDPDVYMPGVEPQGSRVSILLNDSENVVDARGTDLGEPTRLRGAYIAFEGDDRLWGGEGGPYDHLAARQGDDLLVAGERGARLLGGLGADRLFGRRGPDFLGGGPGIDSLRAGAGNDFIWLGGDEAEVLNCGPGEDRVRTPGPEDTLFDCETVLPE